MNEVTPTSETDIYDLTPAELAYISEHQVRGTSIVNLEYLARLYDELNRPVVALCLRRSIEARALRITAIDRNFLGSLLEKALQTRAQNAKLAPQ
jgi:hypothetical protein